ncbi:hypothetical protein [Sphingomonas swuensis]
MVSSQDDSDGRRKIITITPKGWLIEHYLAHLS